MSSGGLINICSCFVLLVVVVVPQCCVSQIVPKTYEPSFNNDGIGHTHPHTLANTVDCPACLDHRLVQHYQVRGCQPVVYGHCRCPSRFRCPPPHPFKTSLVSVSSGGKITGRSLNQHLHEDVCHFNGSDFALGQIVPTENVCRICVCGYLPDGTVGIDCETQIQCPATKVTQPSHSAVLASYFGYLGGTGRHLAPIKLACYEYYEHDKCCPRQECMSVNTRTGRALKPRKMCLYAGKRYQLGERIDVRALLDSLDTATEDDDSTGDSWRTLSEELTTENRAETQRLSANLVEEISCLQCICTESWNNSMAIDQRANNVHQVVEWLKHDQHSCHRKACQLQFDQRFRAGCIPVYREDRCCPVDFVCPRTRQMSMRIRGLDSGSKLCQFEGRKYPVGSRLYHTKHSAAPCVDCECLVPPDFTCLQRKSCEK